MRLLRGPHRFHEAIAFQEILRFTTNRGTCLTRSTIGSQASFGSQPFQFSHAKAEHQWREPVSANAPNKPP